MEPGWFGIKTSPTGNDAGYIFFAGHIFATTRLSPYD